MVIAISSGETQELCHGDGCKNNGCKIIAVTGNKIPGLRIIRILAFLAKVDHEGDILNRPPGHRF